jgi:hypothetical protein
MTNRHVLPANGDSDAAKYATTSATAWRTRNTLIHSAPSGCAAQGSKAETCGVGGVARDVDPHPDSTRAPASAIAPTTIKRPPRLTPEF